MDAVEFPAVKNNEERQNEERFQLVAAVTDMALIVFSFLASLGLKEGRGKKKLFSYLYQFENMMNKIG